MLETDAASRRRLMVIVGFLVFLFGGFAVWGTAERAKENGTVGVGDPAPVNPDRAEFLAERRRSFQTRKQMAAQGKAGDWRNAVRIADTHLARQDDAMIRSLRAEALLRLADPRGAAELARSLRSGDATADAEAELLRGNNAAYGREARRALAGADENRLSALDANNTAWLAALTPDLGDSQLLGKALTLSGKAVRAARMSDDPDTSGDLATFTNTHGGLYYRAGRDLDAIETLLESERLSSDPFNAAFLTLAYDRSGDKKSSKMWRDRLRRHLAQTYATRAGQNYRHQLLLLWGEISSGTQE